MPRSLAYICVEHPNIKEKADKLGPVVTPSQLDPIGDIMFALDNGYSPIIECDEGSGMDRELRANNCMRDGHHYSVVKEIDFFKKR
jgi:hypothetical protein